VHAGGREHLADDSPLWRPLLGASLLPPRVQGSKLRLGALAKLHVWDGAGERGRTPHAARAVQIGHCRFTMLCSCSRGFVAGDRWRNNKRCDRLNIKSNLWYK